MTKPRARDLGIPFEGTPAPLNAITDVAGVTVGYTTLIEGHGQLEVGKGPVRTGVTAVLPRGRHYDPVFAGWYSLNGNGEMTGTTWLEESGFLEGPVMITNTHSVGVVRDAVIAWQQHNHLFDPLPNYKDIFWSLPIVAETYDGMLNDINGFHVKPEHVFAALDSAQPGAIAEGCVGGGTGMVCHGFKGGTGTASRQLRAEQGGYTVGVLLQANHGDRAALMIGGLPMGRELPDPAARPPQSPPDTGSVIVVVATDAPLLPHQLKRLARRVPMGLARVGSYGGQYSGDIFVAFSTANPGAAKRYKTAQITMLTNDEMTPLLEAAVQATEEAVVNAMVAATTMIGVNGRTIYALPHDGVRDILRRHHRLVE